MYEQDNLAVGYALGRDSNSNSNGMFGGDWASWIILFLIFGIFGGWGGFGGFGGNGMNGALTRGDLCQDMNFNNLESSVRGVQQGLCDGFYAMNTSLLTGFGNTQTAIMQNGYETHSAISDLGYRQQQCCCETQRAIDGVNYNMAKNTCDIINTINGAKSEIIGFMTQQELSALRTENQSLKFAASQSAQNAFITANKEAQTAELIRRLGRDCPVPAYVVPNPNCCYGNPVGVNYGGNNCGCGCSCGC